MTARRRGKQAGRNAKGKKKSPAHAGRKQTRRGAPLQNSTSRAPSPHWQGEESRQTLKRSRSYVTTVPAQTVLTHIDQLREFDRRYEWGQMLAYLAAGLGGLLGVGGVLALLQENQALGVPMLLIGVGVAFPAVLLAISFGALNFENRRYELLAGLLRLLKADMATDAPVSVQLDLRPHTHSDKLQRTGVVRYWDVKFFVDRWFDLQGRLVDGTKYSVTMIEKNQHRSRTKRSASGKLKTKTKKKSSSEAIVRLKVKNKRYPRLKENAKSAKEALKLPPWAAVKKFEVTDELLTLRVALGSSWDASKAQAEKPSRDGVELVATMLLSLYQVLNRSRVRKSA